jgi:hypothetical protein
MVQAASVRFVVRTTSLARRIVSHLPLPSGFLGWPLHLQINAASENSFPGQRNNMRDKENAIAADQTARVSHAKSNV